MAFVSPDGKTVLELITSRLETATYVLTLLVGIAGISFLFYNRRLQRVVKAETLRLQRESDEKIATANEAAAEANLKARSAEESAENARLAQKELDKRNLELAVLLEKERQERLRLEMALAPPKACARTSSSFDFAVVEMSNETCRDASRR